MKVSQSMIDAVKSVMESGWEKEKTTTGMKVYGSSYGDSKKARKDQTKSSVDSEKGPTKAQIDKTEGAYKAHQPSKEKSYKQFGAHMAKEEKDCVTKPEAKDIAKKEVKGHEKDMHKEGYDFASQLIVSHYENELVEEEINEVLKKDASAGEWIHDFVHSDNPKFAGKSKAMRKKMALAAYYAKQRNESFEDEHGIGKHDDEKEDKALVKKMVKKSALKNEEESGLRMAAHAAAKDGKKVFQFQGKTVPVKVKKEEVELDEAKVTTPDDNPNRVTTDMLKGREEGGKANSFKSFKLKLKSDGEMKAPEEEKPEETAARKSIKGHHVSEESIDEARNDVEKHTPKKNEYKIGQDVSDKSWLKDAGKKPSPLHNVGKGLKAFLKGKPEPMESVEVDGEMIEEKDKWHSQYPKDDQFQGDKLKKREFFKGHGQDVLKRDIKKGLGFKALKMKEETVDEAKRPEQDNVPFAPPYDKTRDDVVTDKSGAKHTPMSRAKDLARTAMKRIKTEMLGKIGRAHV